MMEIYQQAWYNNNEKFPMKIEILLFQCYIFSTFNSTVATVGAELVTAKWMNGIYGFWKV